MNINTVYVEDIWVSYDIKSINDEIQIVASFIKNGKEIYKLHKISTLCFQNAEMIVKLMDDDFAKKHAREIMESAMRSKHNPFKKG